MTNTKKYTLEELEYTQTVVSLLLSFKELGFDFSEAIDVIDEINGKKGNERSKL